MKSKFAILTGLVVVAVAVSPLCAQPAGKAAGADTKAFEALCEKICKAPEQASEKDMIAALDQATQLARPYAAAHALRSYLAAKARPSLALRKKAVDNALMVGNYNDAMVRCKSYLKDAKPGAEASAVTAMMYRIQIRLLDAYDDAYNAMSSPGDQLCTGADARRFDAWYLAAARRKRDHVNLARRLGEIHSSSMPPAQVQYLYGGEVERLLQDLSSPMRNRTEVITAVGKLAASIRDPQLRTKCALYAANMAFGGYPAPKTRRGAMEPEGDFSPVVAAANAYVSAWPTAQAVRDVMFLFTGGRAGRDPAKFMSQRMHGDTKRVFFVAAFKRLPDAERRALLAGEPLAHAASPVEWTKLAMQYPSAFIGCAWLGQIPFGMRLGDPAAYKRLAAVFQATRSERASAVRALAANGNFDAAIDHFLAREAYDLDNYSRPYAVISQQMWPAFAAMGRDEKDKLPADYQDKALLRFGTQYVAKGPLALDQWTARDYMERAWRVGGKSADDKSAMAGHLASLAWAPYTPAERRVIFEPAYGQFKQWTTSIRTGQTAAQGGHTAAAAAVEKTRKNIQKVTQAKAAAKNAAAAKPLDQQLAQLNKQLAAETKALADAKAAVDKYQPLVAQISPLEAAFMKALQAKGPDANKAPNALCRDLAQTVVAVRAKDANAFMAAARRVYPHVRDYDVKTTLMGKFTLRSLLRPAAEINVFPLQREILADQLASYGPKTSEPRVSMVAELVVTSRPNWGWARFPAKDRKMVLEINAQFAKAMEKQLAARQFSPWLFNAVRSTRYGQNWGTTPADRKVNEDLMARMIEQKTLTTTPWRSHGLFASTSYMGLVRDEFPGLQKKYPLGTYFDDMVLAEAAQTKTVDPEYFQRGGQDENKKIRSLIARTVSQTTTVPEDRPGAPVAQTRAHLARLEDEAMRADPKARDAMLAKVATYYGKTRFDLFAMGYRWFDLIGDVNDAAVRKEFFARLSAYLDRAAQSPTPLVVPDLTALKQMPKPVSDTELDVLVRIFSSAYTVSPIPYDRRKRPPDVGTAASLVLPALMAKGRHRDLFAIAPGLWSAAKAGGGFHYVLLRVTEDMLKAKHYDLAATYSGVGLRMYRSRGNENQRRLLQAVRARAMVKMGGLAPIDRSDPRFPVLAAQAEFLSGNLQQAWRRYEGNKALAVSAVKYLDSEFCAWLIRRNTEIGEYDTADELARAAIQWMESTPDSSSRDARARLLLAYANIAFERPEYPRARALYGRIAAAKEFDGTRAQIEAEFQIAAVDRVTKHYDEAAKRLEKLLRHKERYVQSEASYHLAWVLYDQAQYVEALKSVQRVFAYDSTHADARILEGKINLQIKQLERAARIKVGFSTDQEYIVAGKPLRVSLQDQSLAIAGDTMAIELRVWSDSGDEELFNLVPFADSRTQFEGQINTALAPVKKGDHTLQVLGKDRVHYDFSPQFKKAHNINVAVDHSLAVISDADLYASSGRILSKAEMEERALEQMLRAKLKLEKKDEKKDVALSTYRPGDQIKPGNPINIRVVDADQSVTPDKDKVSVDLVTSSGDRVTVDLTETQTHSGVFEGAAPTSSAPATAFATDSEQGTQPVFVISRGNHPAWVAQPDNKRPKTFSVDLNASESVATMKIVAGVPGRKIKQFLIQTSTDGKAFETIGSWPAGEEVWTGTPRLVQMSSPDPTHTTLAQLTADLSIAPPSRKKIVPLKTPAAKWEFTRSTPGIAHISAAFHMPTRKMRTFRIIPKTEQGEVQYVLLIDGQPGKVVLGQQAKGRRRTAAEEKDLPIEFKGALGQGVHRIDVFAISTGPAKAGINILRNADRPPYLEPCPAGMFDPAQHPMIAKRFAEMSATITAARDGGSFDVQFGPAVRSRVIRLLLADFETDAPAISKIHLTARDGRVLLPSKLDLLSLKTNKILEVVPGDRVAVTYKDPRCISEDKRVCEAFLSATYANGEITAALLTGHKTNADGLRTPIYLALRRFKHEDTICVLIHDADADTSGKLDTVKFTVRTGDGKPVEVPALETEKHSGVFLGKVFVVKGKPKRKSEVQVAEGEDLVFTYLDSENTDPGIPWERTATAESVVYVEPELRIFTTESTPLSSEDVAKAKARKGGDDTEEYVPAMYSLAALRQADADNQTPARAIIGAPLIAELTWPTITQTTESAATIYVQTASARKAYGDKAKGVFDIKVPGTIRLKENPGEVTSGSVPPGYDSLVVVGDPNALTPMDDGRYMFPIALKLGEAPETSFAMVEAGDLAADEDANTLVVKGVDEIFIGFTYTDKAGKTQWQVRKAKVAVDPFFHVTDRRYQAPVEGVFVGDSAYFRVIDASKDVSKDRDKVTVDVVTAGGKKRSVDLTETFPHSGVFKGPVRFVYAGEATADQFGSVGVRYGEKVTATYKPSDKAKPIELAIEIFKGSDGDVQPFTKRFKDPLMAVRTRLTIAEAYFELAKKHRRLGQDDLTEKQIAAGKRLLEEALRDYPDTEARAQVDYLLANLSLELAEESKDKDVQKTHFLEALSRFAGIVANYRGSSYAPKAQYKKALCLEKMGEIDRACEEYVKLSYRWPDNPLIAETIARLGQYFTRKAQAIEAEAEKLEDPVEQEKLKVKAREKYTTAAKVYGRLAVRFPTHKLAEKTTAVSAQCFMKAEKYEDAIKVFERVVENDKALKEVRAESMYWAGDCYMKLALGRGARGKTRDQIFLSAYRMFKNLTWDYPATKWAKYARGRLAGEELSGIDEKLSQVKE